MTILETYQPAISCTGSPTPGARALMAWYLAVYGPIGGTNLGIYNCAVIPGTRSLSLHAEGRAADLGVPAVTGWATALAQTLVDHSGELGVQCVIFNRRIWSSAHPYEGWRTYTGSNPHTDHLHAEVSRSAAQTLTTSFIATTLGTEVPTDQPDWTMTIMSTLPVLREGVAGPAVKNAQTLINVWANTRLVVDGDYGPKTAAACRKFQEREGVAGGADGVVGQHTWTALLVR